MCDSDVCVACSVSQRDHTPHLVCIACAGKREKNENDEVENDFWYAIWIEIPTRIGMECKSEKFPFFFSSFVFRSQISHFSDNNENGVMPFFRLPFGNATIVVDSLSFFFFGIQTHI